MTIKITVEVLGKTHELHTLEHLLWLQGLSGALIDIMQRAENQKNTPRIVALEHDLTVPNEQHKTRLKHGKIKDYLREVLESGAKTSKEISDALNAKGVHCCPIHTYLNRPYIQRVGKTFYGMKLYA